VGFCGVLLRARLTWVVLLAPLLGCELVSGHDVRTRAIEAAGGGGAGGAGGAGGVGGVGGVGGRPAGGGGSAPCVACDGFECVDGVCQVPLPETGIVFRLRADVGVEVDDGGGVLRWTSAVGPIAAVQDFDGDRPALVAWGPGDDRSSLRFDGFGDHLALPAGFQHFEGGLSAFVVARPAPSEHGRFLDLGNGNGDDSIVFGRWSTTDELRYETHDAAGSLAAYKGTGAFETDALTLFEVVHETNGDAVLLRNGAALPISEAVPGGIPLVMRSQCWIGRSNFTSPGYLIGDVMEMVLYDRALSPAERVEVEGALQTFYGIVP
jgi:concanavalin A-like lectin/glucanase superfamily protein